MAVVDTRVLLPCLVLRSLCETLVVRRFSKQPSERWLMGITPLPSWLLYVTTSRGRCVGVSVVGRSRSGGGACGDLGSYTSRVSNCLGWTAASANSSVGRAFAGNFCFANCTTQERRLSRRWEVLTESVTFPLNRNPPTKCGGFFVGGVSLVATGTSCLASRLVAEALESRAKKKSKETLLKGKNKQKTIRSLLFK